MQDAIEGFMYYLRVERGRSPHTVAAYHSDLSKLSSFMRDNLEIVDVESVDRVALVEFLNNLQQQGLGPRSVQRARTSVRQFFKYLLQEKIVAHDPTVHVVGPKFSSPLPTVLNLSQVDQLLATPDQTTALGLRDAAMLELMYSAGLRVSELVSLPLHGVQLHESLLRVVGKRGKERVVPMGEEALSIITRYLEDSRPQLATGRRSSAMFLS